MTLLGLFSYLRNKLIPRRPPVLLRKITCRRSWLSLEPFEDRVLPSCNVISGYVYNDVNNNGLFNPGETPIANSLIQLRNAANVVVGTTITNAQGYYQF